MLIRATPTNITDTGYLEPQPLKHVAPPTTPSVRQDDTTANA